MPRDEPLLNGGVESDKSFGHTEMKRSHVDELARNGPDEFLSHGLVYLTGSPLFYKLFENYPGLFIQSLDRLGVVDDVLSNTLFSSSHLNYLATSFGLPVIADASSRGSLYRDVNYEPLTENGEFIPINQVSEICPNPVLPGPTHGMYAEITTNGGLLIYEMPWEMIQSKEEGAIDRILEIFENNGFEGYNLQATDVDQYVLDNTLNVSNKKGFLNLLQIFAGIPTYGNEQGLRDLSNHRTREYQQNGLIDVVLYPTDEETSTSGHSGANVDVFIEQDVYFDPNEDSLFKFTAPKKVIAKRLGSDREAYVQLTPEEEIQIYAMCGKSGLHLPNTRIIPEPRPIVGGPNSSKKPNPWLLIDYVEGIDIADVLESGVTSDILHAMDLVKIAADEMHAELKASESDSFCHNIVNKIKSFYANEWEITYENAARSGINLKEALSSLDAYFVSCGFDKQILLDLSPNNIKIDYGQDKVAFFDKAYPAYDFKEVDFAVLLYYNPEFSKENRDDILNNILNGKSKDQVALTHYSNFKKNIYGYYFFSEKDQRKSEHRLICAKENLEELEKSISSSDSVYHVVSGLIEQTNEHIF
jgi:hypothetical protein